MKQSQFVVCKLSKTLSVFLQDCSEGLSRSCSCYFWRKPYVTREPRFEPHFLQHAPVVLLAVTCALAPCLGVEVLTQGDTAPSRWEQSCCEVPLTPSVSVPASFQRVPRGDRKIFISTTDFACFSFMTIANLTLMFPFGFGEQKTLIFNFSAHR